VDVGSLSSTLKYLREQAGLSGPEAARRADTYGLSQPNINKMERGFLVPTAEQVRVLCRVYRAPAAVRRELEAGAAALREDQTASRPVFSRGTGWKTQARIRRADRAATVIREFSPLIIPGLLQTEAYMRAVFGQRMRPADLERAVSERLARQEQLRDDQDVRAVMPEGALYWMATSAVVMEEQALAIAAAPVRVTVGIIPSSQPVNIYPVHAVTVYDSASAVIGIWTGTAWLKPVDAAVHAERVDALDALAVHGDEASRIALEAAERYRTLA
jgi:transcriptional regulator with XRE-family HTH domain